MVLGLAIGAVISLVILLIFLLILSGLFWIWMLVDCLIRKFKDPDEKIVWIIVIIFASIIGAIIYFFFRKHRGRIPR